MKDAGTGKFIRKTILSALPGIAAQQTTIRMDQVTKPFIAQSKLE